MQNVKSYTSYKIDEDLKQGEMNQEKNPLGSMEPEKIITWLHHWGSSYNDCLVMNLLSHIHNHKFQFCTHHHKYLQQCNQTL